MAMLSRPWFGIANGPTSWTAAINRAMQAKRLYTMKSSHLEEIEL